MRARIPFENQMTRTQTVLGWIYFPVHFLLLPLLLGMFAQASGGTVGGVTINLIYHGAGIIFVLCVMYRYLRDCFDVLVDRFGRCLLAILSAVLLNYALSIIGGLIMLLLGGDAPENPNNAQVAMQAGVNRGAVMALAIFVGPITEEVLFRGVAFGSLRGRGRFLAYAVSILLFSLYHVWQYVLAYADPAQLLYALQYIPMSLALAWCYEHSGSIWPCIFFHMGYNAIGFVALNLF